MKLRLAQPKHLIDLGKVKGLGGVKEEKGVIVVGAMTTHWEVESSKVLKAKVPVVSETAAVIGDPAVRNKGTIGGSLAHGDPAADMPATAIALGFEFVCEGPKGKRTVKVDDWFKGLMETALKDTELLTTIRIPVWAAGSGAAAAPEPLPWDVLRRPEFFRLVFFPVIEIVQVGPLVEEITRDVGHHLGIATAVFP